MQFSPATNYRVKQVAFITIAWILMGVLVELLYAINYDVHTRKHSLVFIFGENGFQHLVITAIGPLVGGILGGGFIVFYQREKVKGRNYTHKLFIHSALYLSFVAFFILTVGVIGALNSELGFWQSLREDIFSLRVLRLIVTWYFIVILTIFLLDVSEKYGAAVLLKQLMGKYHEPVQEDRVFLFLDLKSSTTIAEKIGNEKYFRMLRFFYQLANEAIIGYKGEIYQYVGDEIVISWEKAQGINNANCLRCFSAIQQIVRDNADEFTKKYGIIPEFKAAIHSGMVTAGEIGIIKKDVVYSGDVLNTTARIMMMCNQFKVDLIVSAEMFEELRKTAGYEFDYIDSHLLRGKSVAMKLYAVRKDGEKGARPPVAGQARIP